MNCTAIFLDESIAKLAYNGYCKQVLWPTFHNVDQLDQIHAAWNVASIQLPSAASAVASKQQLGDNNITTQTTSASTIPPATVLDWTGNDAYHTAYKAVNEQFYQALSPLLQEGDTVWVHDYHLIYLPKFLRDGEAEGRRVSIVFFLHIPFPTSQLFRALSVSAALLRSMVCADLVGFHTFDHARHFLNAAKRILGIRAVSRQGGLLTLQPANRKKDVIVTMSHVSIETDVIDECLADPQTQRLVDELTAKYQGRKVIVGVDVCQRLSGGALKIAALEKLLTDYSAAQGQRSVVLVQRSIRPGQRLDDEEVTSRDLQQMAADANRRFSPSVLQGELVLDYAEIASMSLAERVALWRVADVFLLTAIKEGLNLLPLEYIYSRKGMAHAGVVVVSEFTVCSSLLSGSLKVNPFSTQAVADSVHRALNMSAEESLHRAGRDLPFIESHPSSMWTKNILRDLQFAAPTTRSSSPAKWPLDLSVVAQHYAAAAGKGLSSTGRRVLFFEYGGTLLRRERQDVYIKQSLSALSSSKPTDEVMRSIRLLSEDPQNAVTVMTALTKEKLGSVFSGYEYRNVTLVTSNGLAYSLGDEGSGEATWRRQWRELDCKIDWPAVQQIAVPIINKFVCRTNGTLADGVGWSFFGADPEYGQFQCAQLRVELEAALASFDVVVDTPIDGFLQVIPRGLHKGVLVKSVLSSIMARRGGQFPCFLLIVGDNNMSAAYLEAFSLAGAAQSGTQHTAYTACVGKRDDTAAEYYLEDVQQMETLLRLLTAV